MAELTATQKRELRVAADKTEALRLYDLGVPSTLPPTNMFKPYVEQHRWGNRSSGHTMFCPVCERDQQPSGAPDGS